MSSPGNIKTIPRWKAQLLEKRKSATRFKAEPIPNWKKELIKKIQENHKIGNEVKDKEDQAIISDPIVKVSQNIFVVRESKSNFNPRLQATKNKQQQQQVKFNLTKPENIVIIEKTAENQKMNKHEDLPQQGLVNRLKSRFMENQTSFPDSTHKKSTFNVGRSNKIETKVETKIPLKHIGNTSKVLPQRSTSEIELFTDQINDQEQINLAKSWSRTPSVDILSPKGFKPTSDNQSKTLQLKSSSDEKKIRSKAPLITQRISKPPNKVVDSNKKVAMTTSADKWSRVELHDVKVESDKLGEQKARAYMEMMKGSKTFQITPRGAKREGLKVEKKSLRLPCTDIDEILEDTQDQKPADEKEEDEEEKKKVVAKLDSKSTPAPSVPAPATPVPATPVPAPATPVSAPDSKFRPSINSASSLFGTKPVVSSGRSFTINPKKFKNSAAPPVEVKKEKSKEPLNAMTIIPIKMKDTNIEETVIKKAGRRKPGVDQIEVIGGYIKLAHSCLSKAKTKEKKSVRFNSKSQLNHYHQHPYEDYGNLNSNNNNNRMFNRSNMYIPESERNLDNNMITNKSSEERDKKFEDKPTVAAKSELKQMKSKFITFVDDYIPGSSSNSSSSSDDDDLLQALPTAADDAAIFSDVTTNDLLF